YVPADLRERREARLLAGAGVAGLGCDTSADVPARYPTADRSGDYRRIDHRLYPSTRQFHRACIPWRLEGADDRQPYRTVLPAIARLALWSGAGAAYHGLCRVGADY